MGTPSFHLIAGPNGAGKTTYFETVLGPAVGLPFINADEIALKRWPEAAGGRAYEAAAVAAEQRRKTIRERRSFVSETVFSHPSKVELLREAQAAGFRCLLHVILIPEKLAVPRVALRVEVGGHSVPEEKIVARYRRLWSFVAEAVDFVDEAEFLDNSRAANPFRLVACFVNGRSILEPDWPPWTPPELLAL